jgi:hypothetical protein
MLYFQPQKQWSVPVDAEGHLYCLVLNDFGLLPGTCPNPFNLSQLSP